MTAQELRIGNWVRFTNHKSINPEFHGKPTKITPQDIIDIAENGYDVTVESIPLTPEILEKCPQFTKDHFYGSDGQVTGDALICHYKRQGEDVMRQLLFLTIDDVGDYVIGVQNTPNCMRVALNTVEYLHELQNYFYLITKGIELEVNL